MPRAIELWKKTKIPLNLAEYDESQQQFIISKLLDLHPESVALFCLSIDPTKTTGNPNLWWQGIVDDYTASLGRAADKTSKLGAQNHAMTVLQKLIDDCGLPQPDLSSPIGASLSNQYLAIFGFNIRDYYARKQPTRTDAVPNNTVMIDATTPVLGTVSITGTNGIILHQVLGGNQGR